MAQTDKQWTSNRTQIPTKDIEVALKITKEKIFSRLTEKGFGTFASRHEVLGIIKEEFEELTDAVRSEDIGRVAEELLDIAVAAVFAIACIQTGGLEW